MKAFQNLLVVTLVALLVLAFVGGEEEARAAARLPGLSALSFWAVDTLSTTPEFRKIKLTPVFRGKTKRYEARVGNGVKSLYLLASKNHPDAAVAATRTTPDGMEKAITEILAADMFRFRKTTTSEGKETSQSEWLVDGADFAKVWRQEADYMRVVRPIRVGSNKLRIKVTGGDGENTRSYTVDVVRGNPDSGPPVSEKEKVVVPGADINHRMPGDGRKRRMAGFGPLAVAIANNQVDVVRLLIDGGVDVNHTFPDQEYPVHGSATGGGSVLMLAVDKGHGEMVRLLIEAGADVNYEIPGKRPRGRNPKTAGLTALRLAMANNHVDVVRLLIDGGANVNHTFPDQAYPARSAAGGGSVLMLAVDKGHEEMVRLLIKAGADVNYEIPGQRPRGRNPKTAGLTALRLAMANNHVDVARLLIDGGANVNHTFPDQAYPARSAAGGVSVLMLAVDKGHEEMVRLLIKAGADVNYEIPGQRPRGRNPKTAGLTALRHAIINNQEAVARLLIDGGANVNHTFPDQAYPARSAAGGVSVLMLAVDKGHEEMVRLLIKAGADVNYEIPGQRPRGKNPKTAGLTALTIAVGRKHEKIIKLLLAGGAKE